MCSTNSRRQTPIEAMQQASTTLSVPPTAEAYGELQQAYDHFNRALFGGQLPHCLITLQRKNPRTYGYFARGRFARYDGTITDEIALNPMHCKTASIEAVLQTLVHEMVHLWQAHFGKPSRSAYHNAEWAAKMEAMGLLPSHTGQPGGKKTGQQMRDYPLADGRFQHAVEQLVSADFRVSWYDTRAAVLAAPTDTAGEGSHDIEGPVSGQRVKFTCPQCQANAWGKYSLVLICGTCMAFMTPAAGRRPYHTQAVHQWMHVKGEADAPRP